MTSDIKKKQHLNRFYPCCSFF